jgi:hypothetical protein
MAKLSITDASRVAGVARSTLYRAIQKGRLSADPDGRIDTAELLRAGYTLQHSAQQTQGGALHDATPRNTDTQHPSAPADTQALQALQQERDMLRLERDMLRQQLEAAQMREQAAVEREREARDERQAARAREALLLRLVEQTQQRYDRLLDTPRSAPPPRREPSPHPEPRTAASTADSRPPPADIAARPRPGQRKLTPRQIRALRDKHLRGVPVPALMEEYQISRASLFRYLRSEQR